MDHRHNIAVLLNPRAKRVNRRVERALGKVVGEGNLFCTSSRHDAEEAAREVIRRGYGAVCSGGGDGTLVHYFNAALRGHERDHATGSPPIGVLKLGTGNAIARYVGARDAVGDLVRMREAIAGRESGVGRRSLSLLEVEGRLTHFAGFGLDAAILNDYAEVRDTFLARTTKYFWSVLSRSLPRQLTTRRRKPELVVVNSGGPAYRIGDDGRPIGEPLGHGAVLYRGPVTLVAASTTPYFGYGMQIFPFAGRMPGKMQLRVAASGVFEILLNMRRLWNGTHRSPTLHDYFVDRVDLHFSKPTPFQVGGDPLGVREEATFGLPGCAVDLLDLRH